MTRMTEAELRKLLIANPDLAARNAHALKSLSGSPLSDDVRTLNPEAAHAVSAPHDGADTLLGWIKLLAPELYPRCERDRAFGRYHIDIAIVDSMLAIEINGGRWLPGGGKHGSESDRRKCRRLQDAGWKVYEFTTERLDADPIGVIAEIRQALG